MKVDNFENQLKLKPIPWNFPYFSFPNVKMIPKSKKILYPLLKKNFRNLY